MLAIFKDTYTRGGFQSAMHNADGIIVQTRSAQLELPLLVAPVLPQELLRSIRKITLRLPDTEQGLVAQSTMFVSRTMWYNETAVIFHAEGGGALKVRAAR